MTMPYAAKTQDVAIAESAKEITVRVLESITQGKQLEKLRFRLWDGSYWPNREPSVSTVVLNRPSALKEMLLRGTEAALGEAYIHSAFDIEGDNRFRCRVALRLFTSGNQPGTNRGTSTGR
jgi:hypothetical protein